MKKQSGIALVELILVIGVILILTGIILLDQTPASVNKEKRDTQREFDVVQIAQVINQYKIHNKDKFPQTNEGEDIPQCSDSEIEASALRDALVADYLTQMPTDPKTKEQYKVCLESEEKVKVYSTDSELGKRIEVIR